MSNDAYNFESVIVAMLTASTALSGFTIRHYGDHNSAEVNVIGVECVKGNVLLDGPGGFEYRTTIELQTDNDQSGLSAALKAIESTMETPTNAQQTAATTAMTSTFSYFFLDNQTETDQTQAKSLRTYTRVYPGRATSL